jgi:hypothetical protein
MPHYRDEAVGVGLLGAFCRGPQGQTLAGPLLDPSCGGQKTYVRGAVDGTGPMTYSLVYGHCSVREVTCGLSGSAGAWLTLLPGAVVVV